MNRKYLLLISLAAMIITISAVVYAAGIPDKIVLKSLQNIWAPVQFDHKGHVDVADSCSTCHHKAFGKPMPCSDCHDEQVKKSDFNHENHWEVDTCASCHQVKSTKELACSSCHKTPLNSASGLGTPGLKGALHAQCMGCHKENDVDNSCESCHAKKK